MWTRDEVYGGERSAVWYKFHSPSSHCTDIKSTSAPFPYFLACFRVATRYDSRTNTRCINICLNRITFFTSK